MVDDNEPFRRFIASTLRDRKNFNVIGEACDGLEAVQRAEALQPDLILLDIGMPELNGLDAARQISKRAPNARIIFLTQESAADVVGEALSLGAWVTWPRYRPGGNCWMPWKWSCKASVLSAAA